jgi:hypothetical protein
MFPYKMRNHMKNKFIKLSILGCSAAILSTVVSCQKEKLELTPTTSISGNDAYGTAAKIQAQVNTLYSQLSDGSFYGGRYLVFNEQRGNEFSQNDGNNSTGANVWNQTISSSGDFVNNVWTTAYRLINSANILINKLSTSTVVDAGTSKSFIAEAKFLRALAYFSLVQTYAKPINQAPNSTALPLRLVGETSGGNNNLAFSTTTEVYAQILKDLDDAELDLPTSYSTAILNASRAHKSTAIALKTRVYLVKADYDKVINEAGKIVSAVAPYAYTATGITHSLESDLTKLFNGSYIGNEAVFTIPFVIANEAPGQQSALAYNYLSPVIYLNSDGGIISNTVFGASSTDLRKNLISTNGSGQKMLKKFAKNSSPFTDYVPVIRYAEVLLNYAEALAQKNNLSASLALLKAVRNRADANFNFSSGVSTKEDLLNTIYTERRIELLGEGFRTPDLQRRLLPLPAKTGNAGTAPEVAPSAANYVWPIPSGEISYNNLAPKS